MIFLKLPVFPGFPSKKLDRDLGFFFSVETSGSPLQVVCSVRRHRPVAPRMAVGRSKVCVTSFPFFRITKKGVVETTVEFEVPIFFGVMNKKQIPSFKGEYLCILYTYIRIYIYMHI